MAAHCRDCSYSTQGSIPRSRCPACGSFNVQSDNAAPQRRLKTKEKKTLVEYFILITIWGFLIWGVWDRYLK